MKNLLTLLFIFSLTSYSQNNVQQVEVVKTDTQIEEFSKQIGTEEFKLDFLDLLVFPALSVGYEKINDSSTAFGTTLFINLGGEDSDWNDNLAITPYYRFYFLQSEDYGGYGVFAEVFTKFAFGDAEITSVRMSLAMEQFMNSIISNQSKYDKYLDGQATLTESEERGRILFSTEYNPGFPELSGADCAHCHGGSNFDNNRYMNNGLDADAAQDDIGREAATGDPRDRAKFKVPSLRNIALTSPYMHDGRFTTLEVVVDHYDHGIVISETVDPALAYSAQTGLQLTDQDKIDLINFMKTLTDETMITDERFSDPFQ